MNLVVDGSISVHHFFHQGPTCFTVLAIHSILMRHFSLASLILTASLCSLITGIFVFTTLRDSCFSASYASAFPGECYDQ